MSRQPRSHFRVNHLLLFFFTLACVVVLTVEAADGDLDTSFGSGGKVTNDFNGSTDEAFAVALQSDGKIVVAGRADQGSQVSNPNFALARYVSSAGPPVLTVGNTDDSGQGSLQQAILDSNASAGTQTIAFNIPATDPGVANGVFTIKPSSPLPIIHGDTTIDGFTQTLFTGDSNPNGPEVVIDGSLLSFGSGIEISGDNNGVKGMVVNGFDTGIAIMRTLDPTSSNNEIRGNYIGTDAAGTAAVPNRFGGVSVRGFGSPDAQARDNFNVP